MTVAHDDWTIHRGAVRSWDLDLVDRTTGTPLVLLGASVRYVLAQSYAGPPLIDASDASVIAIVDVNLGRVRITLSKQKTGVLPYGYVVHQVIVSDQDGDPDVVLEGHGTVLPIIRTQ
jgi:hypothetical protein